MFEILAAEIAVQRGQLGTAFNTELSMARQTRDPRLARRATEIAIGGRAFDEALAAARLWAELDPESPEASEAEVSLMLATGRLAEAEPLLVKRLQGARQAGRLDDVYPQWQRFFVRVDRHEQAWQLFERLSEPDLKLPAARAARAAVAASAGQMAAAAAEAEAAYALQPASATDAIRAAQYQSAVPGGNARAIATLEDYVRRKPDSSEAQLALGQAYLAANQPEQARAPLRRALDKSSTNPQQLFSVAQAQYQARDLDEAEKTLRRYLDLPASVPHDNAPAWLFLSQIHEDRQQDAQAIDALGHIDGGELYLAATTRRALLMARTGDVDGAQGLLLHTPTRNRSEQMALVSARSQVLRESGRAPEAFRVLDEALAANQDEPDLLYDHAMAAERIGRLDTMEASLRRLIRLRPDQAHAYNALGYTLADRRMRLSEAQQLIEKAIQLQPGDPQIIDSLGWVQFRQGHVQKAVETLRGAYAMKADPDIGAHLGEVLWTAGRRDEALAVWRESLARDPKNDTLRETVQRLGATL